MESCCLGSNSISGLTRATVEEMNGILFICRYRHHSRRRQAGCSTSAISTYIKLLQLNVSGHDLAIGGKFSDAFQTKEELLYLRSGSRNYQATRRQVKRLSSWYSRHSSQWRTITEFASKVRSSLSIKTLHNVKQALQGMSCDSRVHVDLSVITK